MDIFGKLSYLLGPFEVLNERATPRLAYWLRWGVFGLWLFKLALDPLSRLAYLPRVLVYKPIGALELLSDQQRADLFSVTGLSILWYACAFLCLLTFVPRLFLIASVLAAPTLAFYSTVIRAYGEPVHTDIVLIWTTVSIAGFAVADAITGRKDPDARWPLLTMAAMLTTGYALVGVSRLVMGWTGFFGTTMEEFVIDAGLRAYYFDTGLGWHIPDYPLIGWSLRLGFPVVTAMEILSPLILIWPKFRWFFIPFMLVFHFLSLVMMNIFFFDDMLAYLFLIDWDRPLKPWMRYLWTRFAGVSFSGAEAAGVTE